ncbi:MAG: hypothetical protein ACTSYM_09170 [Candidatus Baldrarchaeia archaeon]
MIRKALFSLFSLSARELIYVFCIFAVALFFSAFYPAGSQIFPGEDFGSDADAVQITYWGFPLASWKAIYYLHVVNAPRFFYTGSSRYFGFSYVKRNLEILWMGFVLNIILYFTLSLAIVRGVSLIIDRVRIRRYLSKTLVSEK